MQQWEQEIPEVVARLCAKIRRLGRLEDYEEVEPSPHPPAGQQSIREYEHHLGLKLPPSYRSFLKLYDGYDGLACPGHLLSIRDVLPNGEYAEPIRTWKLATARYGMGRVLDGIVIAYQDQPNNWVFLDPNKPGRQGELTVVQWEPELAVEYPNLVAFFEGCIEQCDLAVAEASEREASGGEEDDPGK